MRQAMLAAVLALSVVPSVSCGRTMTATLTGIVQTGFDTNGEFGQPNSPLDGAPITVIYRYDTSLGTLFTSAGSEALTSPPALPITSVTIEVGKGEINFTPNRQAFVLVQFGNPDLLGFEATGETGFGFVEVDNDVFLNTSNSFHIYDEYDGPVTVKANLGINQFSTQDGFTGGGFVPSHVTIVTDSLPTGVPEPSTWSLMIFGFGGLGALLKRARGKATFSI
jgi:hypothetical protein